MILSKQIIRRSQHKLNKLNKLNLKTGEIFNANHLIEEVLETKLDVDKQARKLNQIVIFNQIRTKRKKDKKDKVQW